MLWPPKKAYSLSHQTQRKGQPVRRTKTLGRPARELSPCMEKKISLIVSDGVLLRAVTRLLLQALLGGGRRRAVRVFAEDAFQRAFGAFGIAEFLLAGGDVDH